MVVGFRRSIAETGLRDGCRRLIWEKCGMLECQVVRRGGVVPERLIKFTALACLGACARTSARSASPAAVFSGFRPFNFIQQFVNSSPVAFRSIEGPQAMQKWHIHSVIARSRPCSRHCLHTSAPRAQEYPKERIVEGLFIASDALHVSLNLTDCSRIIKATAQPRETSPGSNLLNRKSLSPIWRYFKIWLQQ